MILLDHVLHTAINPALACFPSSLDSDPARCILLAVGLQQTKFLYRFRKVHGDPYAKGPDRGFWGMKRAVVELVLSSPRTEMFAADLCRFCKAPHDSALIHERLEFNDVLAAGIARLVLHADPMPLPQLDSSHDTAWLCYTRNWHPDRPQRDTWDDNHAAARSQVIQ